MDNDGNNSSGIEQITIPRDNPPYTALLEPELGSELEQEPSAQVDLLQQPQHSSVATFPAFYLHFRL